METVGFLGIERKAAAEVIDFTTAEILDNDGHLCVQDPGRLQILFGYILEK